MEISDEQLMLAYQSGDAAAFETLYSRHRGRLFRFVLRSAKERALAEELFQETWMRVIDARTRYTPQSKFGTWLFTIAHNRLVDHWRRKGLTLVALDDDDPPAGASADLPADTEGDPARRAEAREALSRFVRALDALPPAQREVFLLHEEGGLTIAEIAEATGSGAEAAKSRLRYALAKLREALDDD